MPPAPKRISRLVALFLMTGICAPKTQVAPKSLSAPASDRDGRCTTAVDRNAFGRRQTQQEVQVQVGRGLVTSAEVHIGRQSKQAQPARVERKLDPGDNLRWDPLPRLP
jgi:hypothetical protein